MKKLFYIVAFTLSTVSLFAQAGVLDNSFGTKGTKIIYGESINFLNSSLSIDVGKDGKAVIIQNANQSLDTPAFFIKRLLPNGNPDVTFGKGGAIKLGGTTNLIYLNGVKVTNDSKILLYGFGGAATQNSPDALVIKLNSDGSFDNAFGTKGVAFVPTPNFGEIIMSLQQQTDGKLVLTGFQNDNVTNSTSGLVLRMNTNGTLDNSYAMNGTFLFKPQAVKAAYLLEGHLDKQGNLYVRGNTNSGTNDIEQIVIKLSNMGTRVTTGFGTNGIVTIPYTGDADIINLALQNNGRFILSYNDLTNDDIVSSSLVRYNANGTLDNTFGTQGKLVISTNTATKYQELTAIKTMANDKIITNFVGYDDNADALSFTSVSRLLANGTKDNEFGKSGVLLMESDSLDMAFSTIALQENTNAIFVFSQGENEDEVSYNILAKILNPFGVATKENMEVNNFNVFPTVVETQATVTYELTQEETISIQLIDIQGKVVANYLNRQAQMAGKYQQTVEIPSAISSGTYFVNLTNSKGSTSVKIIK